MDWAAIFWIMVFMGGFCLLLVFGELFMNALYEFSHHTEDGSISSSKKCPTGTRRWRNDNSD